LQHGEKAQTDPIVSRNSTRKDAGTRERLRGEKESTNKKTHGRREGTSNTPLDGLLDEASVVLEWRLGTKGSKRLARRNLLLVEFSWGRPRGRETDEEGMEKPFMLFTRTSMVQKRSG